MQLPLVSIVIPCFNQAQFLEESVGSALAQTFADLEIVVVNDGSTEPESRRILQSLEAPKTRVIHQENKGRSAARNRGISEAVGRFIVNLDADDKIGSRFVEKAVELFSGDDSLGIVSSRVAKFGAKESEMHLADYTKMENVLFDFPLLSCAMFRKEDWAAVGGYDESFGTISEDRDLWLSITRLGRKMHKIPEILVYYRMHPASVTYGVARMSEEEKYALMLKTNSQLFKKHIDLYLQHLDIVIPRLFHRMATDRPRFARLKKAKWSLLLKWYRLLGALPPLRAYADKRVRKLERKLENVAFYLKRESVGN